MSETDNRLSKQGERLKKLRKERKKTQDEVAKLVGCGIVSVRDWEKGKRSPDTIYLIKLSELFGVSCDYILGLTDYTNIGNREIEDITGLSNEAVEVLRYISYNDWDNTNRATIGFINRVLEFASDSCTIDSYGDGHSISTVFSIMEEYVTSKNIVASIGGKKGQLIAFLDNQVKIDTVQSLYLEKLSSDVRRILDNLRKIEGGKDNAKEES